MNTININGIEYVPKTEAIMARAEELDGMTYMMVRTYSAGVFAGYVDINNLINNLSNNGKCGIVHRARRIWYWDGAASLSELATYGTSKPENCKFPCEVEEVYLSEIIELIPITERAKKSIEEVTEWHMREE